MSGNGHELSCKIHSQSLLGLLYDNLACFVTVKCHCTIGWGTEFMGGGVMENPPNFPSKNMETSFFFLNFSDFGPLACSGIAEKVSLINPFRPHPPHKKLPYSIVIWLLNTVWKWPDDWPQSLTVVACLSAVNPTISQFVCCWGQNFSQGFILTIGNDRSWSGTLQDLLQRKHLIALLQEKKIGSPFPVGGRNKRQRL